MDKKYNYKNLEVYKESKDLVVVIYGMIKQFPNEEQYALCNQLRRAVISIPSNIAEGSGRTSAKDQAHFFEMAYGSLMEISCQIDIAFDLGYISQDELNQVEEKVGTISALLSGLRKKCLNSLIH
jgi:four helix bundle protein